MQNIQIFQDSSNKNGHISLSFHFPWAANTTQIVQFLQKNGVKKNLKILGCNGKYM